MTEIPQDEGQTKGFYTLSIIARPSSPVIYMTKKRALVIAGTLAGLLAILMPTILSLQSTVRRIFLAKMSQSVRGFLQSRGTSMKRSWLGSMAFHAMSRLILVSGEHNLFMWLDFFCVLLSAGLFTSQIVSRSARELVPLRVVNLRLSRKETDSLSGTSVLNDRSASALKLREGNVCHSLMRALREENLSNGELHTAILALAQPAFHKPSLTMSTSLMLFFSGQWEKYNHMPVWNNYDETDMSQTSGSHLGQDDSCGKGTDSDTSSTSGVPNNTNSSSSQEQPKKDMTQGSSSEMGTYTDSGSSSGVAPLMMTSSVTHGPLHPPTTEQEALVNEQRIAPPGTVYPGWDYDTNKPTEGPDAKENIVMKIAGGLKEMYFYSSSFGNFLAAIRERFVRKRREPTLTEADEARINAAVKNLCDAKHGMFSKRRVKKALEQLGLFPMMMSKKWTPERFEHAWLKLLAEIYPKYRMSGAVKVEPIKEGKAPRPLIADGDEGQVMALISVKVLEQIMFYVNHHHCIKERSKAEAMKELTEHLSLSATGAKQTVIETDGSAWDSCCNSRIRDLIENVVLDHVDDLITEIGWWLPREWQDISAKANKSKKLRLKVCKDIPGQDKRRMSLRAFRRSGARGTSGLNYLINNVLTDLSYFEHPYMNSDGNVGGLLSEGPHHRIKDRWGNWRKTYRCFEGDDGIAALSGELTNEQLKDVVSFWERCGFNMKLFVRKRLAEFCGFKIPLNPKNGCVSNNGVPDILRMINQSAYTTSKEAIQQVKETGKSPVVAAKFESYAHAIRVMPTFAAYFKRCAAYYGGAKFEQWTEDLQRAYEHDFRVNLKNPFETHDYLNHDVRNRILEWEPETASPTDPEKEMSIMLDLGIVRDQEQYVKVITTLGVIDPTWTNEAWNQLGLSDYWE